MKKIFTFLVALEETASLESILNALRIGLNDWDRSRVFELEGHSLVNYTIVTDEETFEGITMLMNGTRTY